MILRDATIKYKGYDPKNLKLKSNKRICVSCDQCGRVRYIQYYQYRDLCFSCSISGNRNHFYHKHHSDETKIKVSCTKQNINIEDFNGFMTKKPYCNKFNDKLKEKIRNKYNRKCFICGKDEKNNKYRLSVHHVDMNKMCGCDDNECILVPLCMACHRKVHTNIWRDRLKYLINNRNKNSK